MGDEEVRTWLLFNLGFDNPINLWLYCCCDSLNKRQLMAEQRSLRYLAQKAVYKWARDPVAGIG